MRVWVGVVVLIVLCGFPVFCEQDSAEHHMLPLFYTMWSRYSDAMKSRDADRVAKWFTEEAVLMEPQTEDVVGRQAILDHLKKTLKDRKITDSTMRPTEMDLCGDRVYQFGTFSISAEIKGNPSVGYSGRFFSVWDRQEDGSWLISRLLMNGVEPPPKP